MQGFRTEHERIFQEIKNAIISRELKPGQRLPQRKMAERFGTTAVTVREVFRSLEHHGLVIIAPKWGAMVVEVHPEKIREKYIVREALEVMAARLIAENGLSESERIDLIETARRCDEELASDRLSTIEKAQLHFSFHEKIVRMTRCSELIDLIGKINLYTILLSATHHIRWQDDVPFAHERLVENIISNPADVAEQFMRKAIQRGYERELKALRELDKVPG